MAPADARPGTPSDVPTDVPPVDAGPGRHTAADPPPAGRRPVPGRLAALLGAIGVLAGLALPFAPVWAEQTTVSWPPTGAGPVPTTAFLAPYRPVTLSATLPCPVLRAAAARPGATTVLATGSGGDGLLVRVTGGRALVLVNARLVAVADLATAGDCAVGVAAGPDGVRVDAAGRVTALPGEPVPPVQRFDTELSPSAATGLAVAARTDDPFDSRGTGLKHVLIAVQLLAAAAALGWIGRHASRRSRAARRETPRGTRRRRGAVGVDAGVLAVLAGWAVIGPLSDDDGFAAMIARNSVAAGFQGNYYRWWNASETPFALAQHVLVPLTSVSLDPLWLRLPSTALAALTWFTLSRGILGAALPTAHRAPVRALAGAFFLAAWLPFNLGVRPEAYLAAGLTGVLALLWRARGMPALAGAALVAAAAVSASPSGVLLAAPVLVFAPKVLRIVRYGDGSEGTAAWDVLGRALLLGSVVAVALTAVFADQTWHAVAVATRWHTDFGPTLPWYAELNRYLYLLSADQDGTATKRVPVLLTLALLPVAGLLLARGLPFPGRGSRDPGRGRHDTGRRDPVAGAAARLAGVTVLALALFWLTPSKWTHHFGALAGVFAAFLTVAVVYLARYARVARVPDRVPPAVGLAGAGLVALAGGLAFSGPNAWWQPVVYDVPWADGPVDPAGVPLRSPLLWAAAAAVGYLLVRHRRGGRIARRWLVAAPPVLSVAVTGVSVAVLLGSFLAAPVREPVGSLALANLRWLSGRPGCGLADAVRVLPDIPGGHLTPAGPGPGTGADPGRLAGFASGTGFDPSAAPPEPPGTGGSTYLWGSRAGGPLDTGELASPWFGLPPPAAGDQVAVSVAGRTDGGNRLTLQFGRADGGQVAVLGSVPPPDTPRAAPGETPTYRSWRTAGVDADRVPAGADRVRVLAVDATTDDDGWLAVTGPRLRRAVGLTEFLDRNRPTLVAWPVAFLYPCVTDPVTVRDGIADAPVSLLETPARYAGLSSVTTYAGSGGDWAALRSLGALGEESGELVGRPGADWGSVLLGHSRLARDRYRRDTTWVTVSGLHG
ncbi:MAG TPA: arabinosyltransferase domain-containing protein [Pseudonocardia sp.]